MSPPRMKLFRRAFLRLAVGAAALAAVSHMARAQSYPARPIRLVVPFPPGGAYDLVGRPLADKLKPLLGTVVIENIGGGGASLGAAAVVRAAADGYTILLGGTQTHLNEALLKSRPLYDPVKDLDPIASVAANCLVIAVHPSVPVRTLNAIIDRIAQATRASVAEPSYQKLLIEAGIEPTPDSGPDKFRRSLAADVALWTPTVKALGLKID